MTTPPPPTPVTGESLGQSAYTERAWSEPNWQPGTKDCDCGGVIDVWADECSDCGPLDSEEDQ